jgi:Holliday junction resolvase RusA-like endonuclease
MSNLVSFVIPGPPVAQARPRATRIANSVRLYDPANVRDYKNYIKMIASQAMQGKPLIDEPICVSITLVLQKPKSWPKKRVHADTKPDLDNYCKAICDGMEGVVYTNDSRIVDLILRKRLGDKPCCYIGVYSVANAEVYPGKFFDEPEAIRILAGEGR